MRRGGGGVRGVRGVRGRGVRITRVRRSRTARRLATDLAAYEPRTSEMLGELTSLGLGPWRCRAWQVRVDGRFAGALVLVRVAFDQWHGGALVLDRAAAAPLGDLIDRSPARSLSGTTRDLAPLRECARRAVGLAVLPWVVVEPPIQVVGEPDASTRMATTADLDALAQLYDGYELWSLTTRGQVRRALRQVLAHGFVMVAEDAGRLLGAAMFTARTPRYLVLDGLTVLPEHRRSGVAWALAARAQAIANALGAGATLALAATNPMPLESLAGAETWSALVLVPRQRFKGQGQLRRLYRRLAPRRLRQSTLVRDPSDPSQRLG